MNERTKEPKNEQTNKQTNEPTNKPTNQILNFRSRIDPKKIQYSGFYWIVVHCKLGWLREWWTGGLLWSDQGDGFTSCAAAANLSEGFVSDLVGRCLNGSRTATV